MPVLAGHATPGPNKRLELQVHRPRRVEMGTKRLVDAIGALILCLFLAPLWLAIAGTIRVKLGRPILFAQKRPGLHEKPFGMLKFRTMTEARSDTGELLPDSERLTSLGLGLRAMGLDELPQLINVMAGDMSLIGPRPLLMRYLPYFTDRERLRFRMRPGITGWAQVNGRNAVAWDERLAFDVWYVEHWSLQVDFRVALRTITTVVRRRGFESVPDAALENLDNQRQQTPPEAS
jgi:sugar transferase EpsL